MYKIKFSLLFFLFLHFSLLFGVGLPHLAVLNSDSTFTVLFEGNYYGTQAWWDKKHSIGEKVHSKGDSFRKHFYTYHLRYPDHVYLNPISDLNYFGSKNNWFQLTNNLGQIFIYDDISRYIRSFHTVEIVGIDSNKTVFTFHTVIRKIRIQGDSITDVNPQGIMVGITDSILKLPKQNLLYFCHIIDGFCDSDAYEPQKTSESLPKNNQGKVFSTFDTFSKGVKGKYLGKIKQIPTLQSSAYLFEFHFDNGDSGFIFYSENDKEELYEFVSIPDFRETIK